MVRIVQGKKSYFLHGLDEFGKWVGIQATISKKHSMKAATYKRFYNKNGTDSENNPLKLYCMIIPRKIEYHSKHSFS